VDLVALTDTCTIVDYGTGANPAIITNLNVACNVGKRFYRNILTQLCIGVNIRQRTNHILKLKIKNSELKIIILLLAISHWPFY
jgi:hypothetical protein